MKFTDDVISVLKDVARAQVAGACQLALQAERVFFIGNGGSAAIASHFAADWTKNLERQALAFNDGALMSCVGNDLGFAQIFALPIKHHINRYDLLFAISSSGESENILRGVDAALSCGAHVVTLSGFKPGNSLRSRGSINFYVPSTDYGVVECVHMCILHAITNSLY